MRISRRGEYGVRAMFDLAVHYGTGPIPLKNIAERQNVPEYYLEQLMGDLRRAGLVTSVRGAQGGYELSRPPVKITIGAILRVLEGPLTPIECLDHDPGDVKCVQSRQCSMRGLWKRLQESMESVLDYTTLESLLNENDLLEGATQ